MTGPTAAGPPGGEVVCPGCGLTLPAGTTPYDGYYHASAECWSVYTEVLAAEYGDAPLFGRVHQMTVDSYAVQHAGGAHPDKSVAVHLVGLHLVLERGLALAEVPRRLRLLVAAARSWPHLEPPAERGTLTVMDVALAPSQADHEALVRSWAEGLWRAWEPHHAAVRGLAELSFAPPGAR